MNKPANNNVPDIALFLILSFEHKKPETKHLETRDVVASLFVPQHVMVVAVVVVVVVVVVKSAPHLPRRCYWVGRWDSPPPPSLVRDGDTDNTPSSTNSNTTRRMTSVG